MSARPAAPVAAPDAATLAVYDADPVGYADFAKREHAGRWPDRFLARVTPGGRVLDLGCGSGWAAALFRDRGFAVEALDASAGLAAEARRRHGIAVRVASFADLDYDGRFDGVWASFSVLHEPKPALPGHLARIFRALAPGGTLYLGLKAGTGEARDALGRFYTYYEAAEIAEMLSRAGLSGVETAERAGGQGFDGAASRALHVFARRDA